LLTLIIVMLHVLSIVCRPYENWKLLLLGACVLGYVGLFGFPWIRNLLALDVTNWSATGFGVTMGLIGALMVEVISQRLRRNAEPAR
jgi:cation-transporting ATPase E